jgi:hypothetical protein
MKYFATIILLISSLGFSFGQIVRPQEATSTATGFKSLNEITDAELIPIAVVIPPQADFDFPSIADLLENKISFIVTQNGMTDKTPCPRFMIFPQISIIEKEYTTTAPVKTVLVLQMNLYVADYIDNKKFSSISLKLKGIGNSDEKAYLNALKSVKNSEKIQGFIQEGKLRIIDYYNANCNKLITSANQKAAHKDYSEAFEILYSIPMFSDCYNDAHASILSTYTQYYENQCQTDLLQAKKYWGMLDIENALYHLSYIYPDNDCSADAEIVYEQIKLKTAELEAKYNTEKEELEKVQHEQDLKKWELITKQYELAIQEYQDEKQFRRKLEERAYDLAIERAKTNYQQYQEKQQNSIIIIR